jgi:hypothetical protein
MAGNQTANFVVKAKDSASGPLGKVGTSMGKLKKVGVSAFKGIAAGAAVVATALAGFAAVAVKGAISEERSIILTNAALRQRGFELKTLAPLVEDQVVAFERFGLEGENVRAGIEAGSRFFKDQNQLLEANAVAANIAAVTEQSLADVMLTIGKAAQGQTRGLKALGIQVEKGATLTDILAASNEKYAGIANELAQSTGGKFLHAQEKFNGVMDELGMDLLPLVNEFLRFIVKDALPRFRDLIETVGPVIGELVDNYVRPLVNSFGELFKVFEGNDINGLELALTPLKIFLEALKITIDAIVFGLKAIFAAQGNLGKAGTTSAGYSPYLANAVASGTFVPPMGGGATTNNIFIGTGKVDTVITDSIKRTGTFKRGR